MRIQIRTLNQAVFDLEVDSTFTIDKIKELIEEKTKITKATQTLIFAGKLLDNNDSLGQANIKDQDFLVLVTKKVPTKAPAPASSQSTTQSQPVSTTTVPPTTVPSEPARSEPARTPANTVPSADTKPTTTGAASTVEPTGLYSESAQTLLTGTQFQSVADEIANSMGFPKEQVILALRASFGNPDRAVEYLISGEIPESVLNQVQAQAPPQQQQSRPPVRPPSTPAQPSSQSQPQTQPSQPQTQTPASNAGQTPQTRPSIPQQPTNAPSRPTTTQSRVLMTGGVALPENIIPPSLAAQLPSNLRSGTSPSVDVSPGGVGVPRPGPGASAGAGAGAAAGAGRGAQNPFMALRDNPMFASLQQLARNDPERFRELMNQLIQSNPQLGQLLAQHGNEFMSLLQGGGQRPQGIQLQITPQDQEALQRLTSLGFSRNRVIEAYFLFEKSEDAAANYLLNTKDDDEEMEFYEGDMEDDDNPDDAN